MHYGAGRRIKPQNQNMSGEANKAAITAAMVISSSLVSVSSILSKLDLTLTGRFKMPIF
jgi:hypothetical protein